MRKKNQLKESGRPAHWNETMWAGRPRSLGVLFRMILPSMILPLAWGGGFRAARQGAALATRAHLFVCLFCDVFSLVDFIWEA